MLRYYLRKIIVCPATYIGAAVLCLSMILSIPTQALAEPAYLFDYVYELGFSTFFLPVAVVLPISYLRQTLRKGSTWQFPILHSTPLDYTVCGLVAAFISGVIVLLCSAGLFHLYVILFLKGPVSYNYTLFGTYYFFSRMTPQCGYLIRIGFRAVAAGMYALIAFGVSGLCPNQYICAASGFAFRIVLSVLSQTIAQGISEKYQIVFFALDPGQCDALGYFSATRDGGLIHLTIYLLVIALLTGGGFYLYVKRRLIDG